MFEQLRLFYFDTRPLLQCWNLSWCNLENRCCLQQMLISSLKPIEFDVIRLWKCNQTCRTSVRLRSNSIQWSNLYQTEIKMQSNPVSTTKNKTIDRQPTSTNLNATTIRIESIIGMERKTETKNCYRNEAAFKENSFHRQLNYP